MKTDFNFSNLLGTVYRKGNLIFTPEGNCLVSPVGNRISVFDLVNNKSLSFPFAHRRNIAQLALTPCGRLLLSVDEDGQAILSNFPRRLVLYHFSFKDRVTALDFSPSGRYFAVGLGRLVQVWRTPSILDSSSEDGLEFAPFVLHKAYAGHYDTIQHIGWSSDSRFFISASKDLTSRLWSVGQEQDFLPTTLAGHRESLVAAWFSSDQEFIYTVSQDGALLQWGYTQATGLDEDESKGETDSTSKWKIVQRHYFMQANAKIKCASYHASTKLLTVGFSNGMFSLHELPDFNLIHTLSISQNDIDFVTINKSGEWLAFGASKLGQLLVWEWQSESYILKQQGHFDSMNALAYSPDGQRIITGADDGKIKVWDTQSSFCIVTFTEHSSAVTACEFAKRGNVLFTSSLDGSIRAWDLIRYRNFRTFTAPRRLSFSSVAVDPSGEVVCAASLDSFNIFIWSVQTGQLLDELAGHEGPVSSLAFAPSGGTVVSGSWDRTARIWNVFGRSQASEPLQLQADILDIAIRPDSKQIAVSTLDGQLTFWSLIEGSQENNIDGRRDVSGGRKLTSQQTSANAAESKASRALAYSADGTCIITGGNSKHVCLYDVESGVLVKKFVVSVNLSLDGTQEFLNSGNLIQGIPKGLIDDQGEASDLEDRLDRTMPGASRGDMSKRRRMPEIRVSALAFSPTGRAFCAASTEGLLVYSLDNALQFDPFDLEAGITPQTTLASLAEKDYLQALVMAFRLNEKGLIRTVYEAIPAHDIALVVKHLPTLYPARLLEFVARISAESPHLELNIRWIEALLSEHGQHIKDSHASFSAGLKTVQAAITKVQTDFARMTDDNIYALDYLLSQPAGTGPSAGGGVSINAHELEPQLHNSEMEWVGFADANGV